MKHSFENLIERLKMYFSSIQRKKVFRTPHQGYSIAPFHTKWSSVVGHALISFIQF